MSLEGMLNAVSQQSMLNNAWSAEQAKKQMDFQERMSSTAHRREMEDLKAAGLNPVLSARQGASTPSGSMGDTDTSNVGAMVELMKEFGSGMMNSAASGFAAGAGSGGNGGSAAIDEIINNIASAASDIDWTRFAKDKGYRQQAVSQLGNAVVDGTQDVIGSYFGVKNPNTLKKQKQNLFVDLVTSTNAGNAVKSLFNLGASMIPEIGNGPKGKSSSSRNTYKSSSSNKMITGYGTKNNGAYGAKQIVPYYGWTKNQR